MNEHLKEIRIDELTLKSLEQQLTDSEQAELTQMLKNPQHLLTYQDIIRTVANLQNIDTIVDRIEEKIQQKHFSFKQAIRYAAAAACLGLALFWGMKMTNSSPDLITLPVEETIFSKSSDFDKTADQIERKIRSKYPLQIQPIHGGFEYSRVKSEITTLKQKPILGKENNDV